MSDQVNRIINESDEIIESSNRLLDSLSKDDLNKDELISESPIKERQRDKEYDQLLKDFSDDVDKILEE